MSQTYQLIPEPAGDWQEGDDNILRYSRPYRLRPVKAQAGQLWRDLNKNEPVVLQQDRLITRHEEHGLTTLWQRPVPAQACACEGLRAALEGMLENYLELKRISLISARSDAPNWMPGMTENDDVHVTKARKALAESCPCQQSGDVVLLEQFHQLVKDNKSLRGVGCALATAALRVIKTFDGTHRLALAVSAWSKALADEGGRAEQSGEQPISEKGGAERTWDELQEHNKRMGIPSPPAAASEAQEWTPDRVAKELLCDCEVCAHTAAICPASASGLIEEVAYTRNTVAALCRELAEAKQQLLNRESRWQESERIRELAEADRDQWRDNARHWEAIKRVEWQP